MSDLVKRLHAHVYALATMAPETAPATLNLLREAADRIEELEARVQHWYERFQRQCDVTDKETSRAIFAERRALTPPPFKT